MSKIKRFFKGKSLLRNIIVGILIIVTIGAAVGGIVALSRNTDKIDEALTYKSIGWTSYKIGGLAPSNGEYMSTDASVFTKKAFECQGLNVTPVFDNDVSYEIYFYNQNNEFVHRTGRLTGAFVQDSVPFFAKYARIVVTPNEDNKVTIFELAKYAKQIEVKVYREQGFKNYTENLFKVLAEHAKWESHQIVTDNSYTSVVGDFIDITPYTETMIFKENGENLDELHLYLCTADKTNVGNVNLGDVAVEFFVTSLGVTYYSVPTSALTTLHNGTIKFISMHTSATNLLEVYCR